MTRTSLPVAVAVAVSGGLLLAACGGGGGSDSSDPIHPATTAPASAPPATTPAQTQAAGPKAPTFDIPSDITIDFKGFTSSDPKKQAALTDATYAARAVIEFEAKLYSKETANFKRFWTGGHGAEFADSIISQGKDGTVVTGTFRYYNPVVKAFSTGNVSVKYCEDQRKAYSKDAKTGKVNVTAPSADDFMFWTLDMTKASSGEWHVYNHGWVEGAKQCQVT
jgi:hypothetical protein